ncbi:NAD-glutamate dehydrogenase [Nesterenkonia aurantiaca]|uniref:Glutamate dehydrogenase n=1 Tax=Nesterenkonia aurantiaca TaxID=1436010 RepID=A0A4R7G6U0_9MICC|nr:NAD-glutamate dehydrogenase [Nesterenkonia aurantiaca]TDS87234.1 glutamate dehydrogenase [Nesterenkonia aurantiaca]
MPAETILWTSNDADLETLTDAYFAHIASEDRHQVSADRQQQRVREHLHLAETRTDSSPVIQVVQVGAQSLVQVVTDDMPYLVDSVTAEVTRHGHGISLVVHPILLSSRSTDTGHLVSVKSLPSEHRGVSSGDTQTLPNLAAVFDEQHLVKIESWITIELDRVIPEQDAQTLVAGLHKILLDVKASHRDQDRMIAQVKAAGSTLREASDLPESRESADLLQWMGSGNFLFLGYREYQLADYPDGSVHLDPLTGTGLGILADQNGKPITRRSTELSAAGRQRAGQRRALVITKANSRSTVRRRTYMDYVAIKTFHSDGTVKGERRFIGLFSERAYSESIVNIPLLRSRAEQLLRRSGFAPDSHSGNDLMQILETYPRNELLQMEIDEIEQATWQIMQLQERRRVKLFLRRDHYGRFMTALVYLPRDRYNTAVRRRIEQELLDYIAADSIDFNVRLTDSVLARVFFRLRLADDAAEPTGTQQELEQRLTRAVRSWSEGIAAEAGDRYSSSHASAVAARWGEAFPDDYRVLYEVPDALADAAQFEALEAAAAQGQAVPRMSFYRTGDNGVADMRLKLYLTEPKTLTDTLPVIDDFGLEVLDERSYTLQCPDGATFHLYDLGLFYPESVDADATIGLLQEAYQQVLIGRAESDIFSQLVLRLSLSIRSVTVLRAYAKYYRQLGSTNSYSFVAESLLANPEMATALVDYFEARFDPDLDGDRDQLSAAARERVTEALEQVRTLDADRVLSALLNLIDSTQRTNLYQDRDWLSLKLTPATIDAAPAPRPAHEIWVYSPLVEGVHLRFAKVARGGLRWSDRREDFRTEVLGLVKAQMAKNAVIVPSGAKGGFFPKQLPDPAADRAAWAQAGQDAYKIFIRALLDITDNQSERDGQMVITHPERVVRHDGDDAYLVVAADKGTATFSDTANAISKEYGHWLGDAFASGGSVGYDHKAMGITARGAWESVKSHFSELGLDTQREGFTVMGIGDMGGDVFGNGMLLSEHIQLVAAFNHLHIFIDPDPDAAASFAERQRLFTAQRSGWSEYNLDLISAGGGVFSRTAKTIEVTEQMRRRFDLPEAQQRLTPPELINALLKAPVDLIYNGGIGTYVKASTETHEQVGDRANNAIRVDGEALRARVVGEGGNLGLTQAGRIEAAQTGVLLNTDAIDNSAGVDCSDHEVNIKILIDQLVESGHLDVDERSDLLSSMTEDVAALVLETNRDQNVLLMTDRHRVGEWSPSFQRLISWLEDTVGLDRELEVLPTDGVFEERAANKQRILTSPELSVLAAYAKIQLKAALVENSVPDDDWFGVTLQQYFPAPLRERFSDQLARHPLHREIIANVVANDVINVGGAAFVFRAIEETFAAEEQVVRSFVAVRELFALEDFDAAMRELPVGFDRDAWANTYRDMRRLLDRAVRWFINHVSRGTSVREDVATYAEHIAPLYGDLSSYLRGEDRERVERLHEEALEAGMPAQLATWVSQLFEAFSLLDIATLARDLELDSREVAGVYYAVYADFSADSLLNRITNLPREDKWQALARGAQRDELYGAMADIAGTVLRTTSAETAPEQRLEEWKQANGAKLARAEKLVAEVDALADDNIASLTVLLRHLRGLVDS